MPYAVIAEKYVVRIALDAAIKKLFQRPRGSENRALSVIAVIKLSPKCVLGISVKPACSSAFEREPLMISR